MAAGGFYVDDTGLTSKADLSADSDVLPHPALRRPLSIVICCRESGARFIVAGTAEDMSNGDEPTNVFITTLQARWPVLTGCLGERSPAAE